MVHLCVSISDDGPRLESVQKGSPRGSRRHGRRAAKMATMRHEPGTRTSSARQNRGSCSSTASCPVFSGSYSDQEEEPPLRRQSSPLIKGPFSSSEKKSPQSCKGSLSSLQGSVSSLQGSPPSLKSPLQRFQGSLPSLKGSIFRFRRHSLGSLENSSPNLSEESISPGLQDHDGSSSDDDGSWDTNSWSSGATCLYRTPVKQEGTEETPDKKSPDDVAQPEIIYQNLIFSSPKAAISEKTSVKKDPGTLCSPSPSGMTSAQRQSEEDRRRFSNFLNEVTGRVIKSKNDPPQQKVTLRHRKLPPPPLPPTTPLRTPQVPLLSAPTHLPPFPFSSTTGWHSSTTSNLHTIKEHETKVKVSPFHQWSKTLPSCKILEPEDVLRKITGKSHSSSHRDLDLFTKIQTQPTTGRLYLETDIDSIRRLDDLVANDSLAKEKNHTAVEKSKKRGKNQAWERNGGLEKEDKRYGNMSRRHRGKDGGEENRISDRSRDKDKRFVQDNYGTLQLSPCDVYSVPRWPEGCPQTSYRSTSLPRTVNCIQESDGEMQRDTSSLHDHKDDLRKHLSYTTHKLEMMETEFDSTRQYLETELRRAQEELEKFSEKLRRIQSSYAALQRINQDLEDKMLQTSQHHEEEKRALSREIIVLNNHLMEAKITINKLREDNDVFRKDCNLAVQLLQCSKSQHRGHKMSELPLDLQERISTHMEKHHPASEATVPSCHSVYPDAVPTSIIAKVLEKPEPGRSCPSTRSTSPRPHDSDFLTVTGSTDNLNRRIIYKNSDLYCSDTALYCPERWHDSERRQSIDLHSTGLHELNAQDSIDSNQDEEAYPSGSFSHHEPASSYHQDEFGTGSPPVSSSYSSFSLASDEKDGVTGGCPRTRSGTFSSSHQGLYMDWRDGGNSECEHKGTSSYDKEIPGFQKSRSIQHMVAPRSPQKGTLPSYTRTASCFSEPYHSSTPRLPSSHSMGSTTGLAQASGSGLDLTEDELSNHWRQLSVEDIAMLAASYGNIAGRVSPYSFSECHIAMAPSSKVKESLYSCVQEGDDVFQGRILDDCFGTRSGSPSHGPKKPPLEPRKKKQPPTMYRAKEDSQDSESGPVLSGTERDSGAVSMITKKDYASAGSSGDSLDQCSLEASSLQHYPSPRPAVRPRPSSALTVGPALPKKTSPRYQKFGSTGLTRKDSLTKAQLYGTLLN
ncbi:uncharacterized protein LOC128747818 isoform X1 [Synchiropus splendidus]|uniref:uncharacterized protein LOC128747818 isoform X1 n=1 Tax=Synchiropus splendidus TaxID=270530 RepID=UPI00237E8D95|nr:uncharacterized protein LOC128747818 isoform X1 [Synchiropus splendidus]